jgi:hypothetical protein
MLEHGAITQQGPPHAVRLRRASAAASSAVLTAASLAAAEAASEAATAQTLEVELAIEEQHEDDTTAQSESLEGLTDLGSPLRPTRQRSEPHSAANAAAKTNPSDASRRWRTAVHAVTAANAFAAAGGAPPLVAPYRGPSNRTSALVALLKEKSLAVPTQALEPFTRSFTSSRRRQRTWLEPCETRGVMYARPCSLLCSNSATFWRAAGRVPS